MDNLGYIPEGSFQSINNNAHVFVQTDNFQANIRTKLVKLWNSYQWRMRHYFYIHLSIFFFNSLLSGFIVWNIEEKTIPYVDCWFIGATCVFTCGLQTVDFGTFSRTSQIILLIFTLISGITVSTIPAIIIKIYRAKKERTTNEEISLETRTNNDSLPIHQYISRINLDPVLQKRLRSLPNPQQLRVNAYIILILAILSVCFMIYFISILSMGFWLNYHYELQDFSQPNITVNSFYAALVIALTGFNQNGLTVWKNTATVFVSDVFMNIVIMIIVMSGTSLFPALLRGVINLIKYFSPWKYKIYSDYILLNNHRLSTVIYPSIQTRLYVTITILLQILGVTVAMILDYKSSKLAVYTGANRFMIFMFHTVNTRFAGFATINISELSIATILIFTLLMFIKPQMLCTINETPFEMEWVLLQTQPKSDDRISSENEHPRIEAFLPFDRMKHYLSRQGSIAKAQAKKYFAHIARAQQVETAFQELAGKHYQRRLSSILINTHDMTTGFDEKMSNNSRISLLRMKLLFIIFCREVILNIFSLLTSTRTYLFVFIFLICAFEAPRIVINSPVITLIRIIFEVTSAFGGCGLSLGFSLNAPSLAAILSLPSKLVLILAMCIGRHRGLLDSMKDQEEIEYSAQTLLDSWRQLAIYEYQQKEKGARNQNKQAIATIIPNVVTPPLSTRF